MVTPAMIQRVAHGDGPLSRRALRSMRRLLSSVSILCFAESYENFFPGGISGGEKTAHSAHEYGKQHSNEHDLRGHAQLECNFTKGDKASDPGGAVVQRGNQQPPRYPPKDR